MAGSKTPIFDWDKGEFKADSAGRVLIATDEDALEQVAIKAHSTARGVFLIYADLENAERDQKYGTDVPDIMVRKDITPNVRESEIKRALREALIYDPWITDVKDIKLTQESGPDNKKRTVASYTLVTAFDREIPMEGVVVNG